MSAIIGTPQYNDYFGTPAGTLAGGITASMAGGSFVASLLAGGLSDRFGRRASIQYSCIFWIIGSVICCAAQNVGMLIAGRFINGLCVGITSSQVPVYLSEIAKRRIRGRIVVIQQWAIEWGILIMYLVGYGCSYINSTAEFRIPWGLQAIPAILLFILLPMFPRSPRWLASKGRWDEATETLANINANGNRNDPAVLAEISEIREALEEERKEGTSYFALFRRHNVRRTMLAYFVQVWQQLAGGNVMMYYVVYVFEMAGLTGQVNLIASLAQYIIMVVFQVPVFFYIDRIGRRAMLLAGSLGMGIFIFAVGGILATQGQPVASVGANANVHITITTKEAQNAVLVCSYFFILVYTMTLAPVAWCYAPECLPLSIRAPGMGFAASGNWIFNFALGFFVPPAFNNIGWKTFMIFGTFCFAMFIHFFLAYPETACKSLEEIDDLFAPGAPPPWRTHVGHSRLEDKTREVAERLRHEHERHDTATLRNSDDKTEEQEEQKGHSETEEQKAHSSV